MAIRKPLVINAGQVEQLQAGDTLDDRSSQISQTNDEAGAIVIGNAVYNDANDGVKKAQSNAAGTKNVLGLVSDVTVATGQPAAIITAGVLSATTAQWDTVAGTSGGLTRDTIYYLDPATAGKITATAPTTVGQYVVEIGKALSTTELNIRIQKDILL
jgi:hypothetical protein